jgi:tRNA1(Val) A37 N6-methylase TrmN6
MEGTPPISAGTLLDGRVIYCQPRAGYRSGIEPILLAASVPARPGERVLELGTGAGAGLLALCARVERLSGVGIERDRVMAQIATDNFAANRFGGVRIVCGSVEGWRPDVAYDHAFANPPWHKVASTPSTDAAKRTAKVAGDATLAAWIRLMASAVRHRGTLSLILPAGLFGQAAHALLEAKCGEITLLPLWPKPSIHAKLVILQAVRDGKGACRVLPGVPLHTADGSYTADVDSVLRGGAGLSLLPQPSR